MLGHFSYSDVGIQVTWNLVDENPDSCLQDLSWSVSTLKPSLPNECYREYFTLFSFIYIFFYLF